ncbi:unnamed protein product [Notodromas monacha]|uniref:DAGKc domain-containing protein n=1 Tax=Notodromas monacha TaxID=399045 RepID=A0A7R9GCC5_9CRUS|nr:unnamed protein product [Notodromas monacha]CAG0915838.1 unnamed protein product [Notodromas monacha]
MEQANGRPGQATAQESPDPSSAALQSIFLPATIGSPVLESSELRYLHVYYAYRKSCSQWVVARLTLCHSDADLMAKLEAVMEEKLSGALGSRPRRVLVFINPFGGHGNAEKIYSKKVAPILRLAGIKADVTVTTKKDHAYEYLSTAENTLEYDSVVGVGGDGLLSEIVNGLWTRVANEDQLRLGYEPEKCPFPVVLGVIPGGSTNTLDYSLNGRSCPINAAINIALGRKLKMDVMGIYQNEKLSKLCFNGIFYGFLGDLMEKSEKLRFLGPPRYNLSGVQTFLSDCRKTVKYEYRGGIEEDASMGKLEPKCQRQCSTCATGDEEVSANSEEWKTVAGKYIQVSAMCHTLLSNVTPKGLSPGAHLGDGFLDVICVKNSAKFNVFRFLFMTRFLPEDKFSLPFVTFLRVKEFRILPGDSGCYNCDGELIPATDIHCKVFRQMLEVYSHGCDTEESNIEEAPQQNLSGTGSWFSRLRATFEKNKGDFLSSNPKSAGGDGSSSSTGGGRGIDLLLSWRKDIKEFSSIDS